MAGWEILDIDDEVFPTLSRYVSSSDGTSISMVLQIFLFAWLSRNGSFYLLWLWIVVY